MQLTNDPWLAYHIGHSQRSLVELTVYLGGLVSHFFLLYQIWGFAYLPNHNSQPDHTRKQICIRECSWEVVLQFHREV